VRLLLYCFLIAKRRSTMKEAAGEEARVALRQDPAHGPHIRRAVEEGEGRTAVYTMTAYCGLDCRGCPAYLATQENDTEALERVAGEWSRRLGMDIPAETIICDGCKAGKRMCSYCFMCRVRECAVSREVPTCAHCEEYACRLLEACPGFNAGGKENLEAIRASL